MVLVVVEPIFFFFLINEIMLFFKKNPSFYLCEIHIYIEKPSTFSKSRSGLSIKSRAHYTKIELSNFDEYTIAMEKK